MGNWGVHDKNEACASLKPGASPQGGWELSQLSESGRFMRNYLRNGVPSLPETPDDDSDDETPNHRGCCSWNGGLKCSPTTEYCESNKMYCEVHCGGQWIPGGKDDPDHKPEEEPQGDSDGDEPTKGDDEPSQPEGEPAEEPKDEPTDEPAGEPKGEDSETSELEGCCSWDGGHNCGDKSPTSWCNGARNRCENQCSGKWKVLNGQGEGQNEPKEESKGCCSWDGKKSCHYKDPNAWCNLD